MNHSRKRFGIRIPFPILLFILLVVLIFCFYTISLAYAGLLSISG